MMASRDYDVSVISIHALREEGDSDMRCGWPYTRHFYPRPPRGGRLPKCCILSKTV